MPETMPATINTEIVASPVAAFTNPHVRGYLMEVAEDLAKATIIPASFQRKPADCFLALHIAARLNADPLVIMQNLYVVQGKPGWNAAFAIAQANASGVFSDPIQYEQKGEGEDLAVRAYATLKATGTKAQSITVDMRMAAAEGWTKNKKYQTMPALMLRYRAATFLIRQYCPEVLLGMHTADELADVQPLPREQPPAGMAGLREAMPAHDPETGEILDGTDEPQG